MAHPATDILIGLVKQNISALLRQWQAIKNSFSLNVPTSIVIASLLLSSAIVIGALSTQMGDLLPTSGTVNPNSPSNPGTASSTASTTSGRSNPSDSQLNADLATLLDELQRQPSPALSEAWKGKLLDLLLTALETYLPDLPNPEQVAEQLVNQFAQEFSNSVASTSGEELTQRLFTLADQTVGWLLPAPDANADTMSPIVRESWVIHFEPGQTDLTPAGFITVGQILEQAHQHPSATVLILGYADRVGDEQKNYTLSEQRAAAIALLLTSRGVSPEQVKSFPMGETIQRFPTADDVQEPENRRAEIVLYALQN